LVKLQYFKNSHFNKKVGTFFYLTAKSAKIYAIPIAIGSKDFSRNIIYPVFKHSPWFQPRKRID